MIQGDVYLKIIEEVVAASANDFEESGVGQTTLNELQQVSLARDGPKKSFAALRGTSTFVVLALSYSETF